MAAFARMVGMALLAAGLGLTAALAEPLSYFLPEDVSYDAAVETPDVTLGHELGEHPARLHLMADYLTRLAETSDRMSVETIGYSHERRPILHFVVSAPENLARIDEIRENHLAAIDPENDQAPSEDAPAVVWLNFGVHGAESSAADAVIPLLYHLAAAEGSDIERTLERSVILVTALFNPDGNARRIDHVDTFAGATAVTDPAHELHQLWVAARTNHYWFDLNRQWLLLTQPEAQAWIDVWHRWKPHVSGDYHEMGSNATYYFHPGEPLRRNVLIPDGARELALEIAGGHAAALDDLGELYYSEEGFDNFYVGKGSTYPQVNGGVGILFEAAAARGGRIETDNGERTFAQNIRLHFRTSLSTIAGAVEQRAALQAYQRTFFRTALEEARAERARAYVFTADEDPARLWHFLNVLDGHDIRVHELAEDVTISGQAFAAGESYVVPLAQAQYRMIQAIFARFTEFEENIFYDVSGWTMPLAYDLDYAEAAQRDYSDALLGPPAALAFPAAPAPQRAEYGYVFAWSHYYAPRALQRLHAAGVRTRAAREPFTARTRLGETSFAAGAIFVPMGGQAHDAEAIHALMAIIAREDGVPVSAVTSGATPDAGRDFGAPNSFATLDPPSVLLLHGGAVSQYDTGEIWHLLDYRMGMPVTMREADALPGLDLTRYTHIVLPGLWGGENGPNGGAMDERAAGALRGWVRGGGTLVALRQSAAWAQETLMVDPPPEGEADQPRKDEEDVEDPTLRLDYADRTLRDAEHVIGGALLMGDLDVTHPLGFGYGDRQLPVHRNTTVMLDRPADDPFAVVVEYVNGPLLSGYASAERLEELSGAPAVVAERFGGGAVIAIADNPAFRGTMFGANKLFLNAVFFSDLFQAARGVYVQEERPPRG